MGIDLGTATVTIAADYGLLRSGVSGAKVLMLDLAAAAADAADASLKMAGDFQQANTQLVTSAGESVSNLKMVSDGVLQTSIDTGTTTQNLEAAMYTIESSGAHGAAALADLKAAAEGAKAENAQLSDVANAETTIMVDFADKHITAANAINDLIATVSRGKTHLQDLAASFSNVLPTANAVGVSLYDVSGAMATMTGEGVDAASSATYLRQLLLNLDAPGKLAASTLQEIGLTTADVANEMKISLPDTLAMIEDHLKAKFPEGSAAYVAALKDIAGGTKTIQGILDLTGTHLQTFQTNVDQITASVQKAGTQISGWALVQQNFNFQLDQARQMVDVFGIKIGTALMPEAQKLVALFQQDMLPQLNNFSTWVTGTGIPELDRFGSWFSGTAVPAAEAFGNTVERNLLPPIETLVNDTVPLVEQFASWVQNSQVVQLAVQDVSSTLGTLVSQISSFEEGLMNGNPQVALLAGGLTAVGTAIGLIKIEEFAAGLYNSFQKLQEGNGFIANLSAKTLPELNTALGWTKTAAQDASTQVQAVGDAATTSTTEVEAFGTEIDASAAYMTTLGADSVAASGEVTAVGAAATGAETVVTGAALGMTAAMAAATAGISLLIGAVVAAVIEGNGKISSSFKDTESQLGNSAADNAAKAKATALETATVAGEQWHSSYAKQQKDANDTEAIAILDQQKIADAAATAAQKAQDAWNQWLLWYAAQGIDPTGRNFDKPTQAVINANQGHGPGGHVSATGGHAAGGTIGAGELGFVSEPGTGGELVEGLPGGGAYVYTGAQSRAILGGGGGGVQEIHIHNHHYWNGREVTNLVMTEAVKKIRVATGAKY